MLSKLYFLRLLLIVSFYGWCKMQGRTVGLAYFLWSGIVYMQDGSFLVRDWLKINTTKCHIF